MMNKRQDGKILIPLRDYDGVELFIPYIEKVARPGSIIVFLIHVGHWRFKTITDQLLAIHTGLSPTLLPGDSDDEIIAHRMRAAEQEIFPACVALREKGMEIMVSVFAGPLRKVVRDYAEREEIHLIMMQGTARNWLSRSIRTVGSFVNLFRVQALPPVLVFHPSSVAGRAR
jgi:nucleotide-binding universal stress UspA family protein